MYRIQQDHEAEIEIKKSRFITYLHRTFDEEDAKAYLLQIKKLHPNATHHCYAMILGEQNECQRSNDDGEPSGTAGVPMLECLFKQSMQDIIAITVRYFGGVKLGAGGLIRAYSKSVSNALASATLTQKQTMQVCSLEFSYDLIGKIDYFFRSEQIEVLTKEYEETVHYTFLCKEIPEDALRELSAGQAIPQFMESKIIEVCI